MKYSVGGGSGRVSDDFVSSVEVIEGEEKHGGNYDVDHGAGDSDFTIVENPVVS
jgi:hypothetical protein